MLGNRTKLAGKSRRERRFKNKRMLQLNVTSPRIVFFQSMKRLKGMARKLVVLGVIAVLGFFAYQAVHRHFNDNEEFAIQYIPVTGFDGKDTVVLSKEKVWELSEIDLKGTIFEVDLKAVERRLSERPEVIRVAVKRRLPDSIEIKLEERVPVAWLLYLC